MQKISELLSPPAIILDLKANEKVEVIKELTSILIEQGYITNVDEFFSAILKRENIESTGIGLGVAIPHARTKAVKDIVLAFGRSRTGVNFSSLDGKPSHLVFLIAAPEEKKSEYIITLARLSKLLRNEEVRFRLTQAKTPDEVLKIITKHE
ncbi:MAG: PTS sugar transporter subunit IIA [candidate division WOR-3 bacterium]|nr:PTS sugar transporter subunit IIA [candidate division WOR-3 bacterium]